MIVTRHIIASPVGDLFVLNDAGTLIAADFVQKRIDALVSRHFKDVPIVAGSRNTIVQRIEAYFRGEADELAGIATRTFGTPFQERVWSTLRRIPSGTTISYSVLAGMIGRPEAARAVALANSMNPVAIVIPCHRVIGKSGALTGYAGGLARKGWLLEHERWMARLEPKLERLA